MTTFELQKEFEKQFGTHTHLRNFFSPGRVNLIGEHTDYNGGFVFPCALNIGTYAVVGEREDDVVRMYSLNFEDRGIIEFSLKDISFKESHDWANYAKGVMSTLEEAGYHIDRGMDILFFGNIPNGAGLSSSASLEVLMGVLLDSIFSFNIDRVELVKFTQRSENNYIGVNCGIMDMFAVGMGKENSAILLDCNTLKYQYAPLTLDGISIVIANTNKRRGLADSKYNERRGECESALKKLQQKYSITSLGEMSKDQFLAGKELIGNDIWERRARHAVYENIRTQEAVQKLQKGDLEGFGKLMNESHISLRDDYEVTGKELDSLVEASWEAPGIIGSRMTGAGFGGCTVSLVKDRYVDDFIAQVSKEYTKATDLMADFYVVKVGDGAKELN